MNKFWLLAPVALVAIVLDGCVAPPRILHPGPEKVQQRRAEWHDPYPENETGGDMLGTRPREYENPRAEVLRAQPRRDSPSPWPGTLAP
jgi:hypothetical protein